MNTRREAEDAELARALIAREPYAPRALWRRFAPVVLRILRRSFGPGQGVEDVLQDVFLCVFERVATLREPTALRKFIMSIAAITVRSEIRRRWFRRWSRLALKEDASKEATFHVDMESRDALRRFYGVLERLNANDRTLFVLRFIEQLGVRQVAEASGLSLATTKRRLARARSRVQLFVERDPILREYMSRGAFSVKPGPDSSQPAGFAEVVVGRL